MKHFLLLLLACAVGGQQMCTTDESAKLSNCTESYKANLQKELGTTGTCNQTKAAVYCSNYTAIVNCVNVLNVNNTGCAPHIVMTIDDKLGIICKVADFKTACPSSPVLNETPYSKSEVLKPEMSLTILLLSSLVLFNKLLA